MSATVNCTGAVDRELLKRAKVIAAKSDTSINALFNAELRYRVETFEAAEASSNQNFKTLLLLSGPYRRSYGHEHTGHRQPRGCVFAHGTNASAPAAYFRNGYFYCKWLRTNLDMIYHQNRIKSIVSPQV
jgi:hypothetical protein